MRLEISWFWAIIAVVLGFVFSFGGLWIARTWQPSHLRYSYLSPLKQGKKTLRLRLAPLPTALKWLSLGLFLCALARPRLLVEENPSPKNTSGEEVAQEERSEELPLPTEGIALYFVLDRSSSMTQEIGWTGFDGRRRRVRRIDILKEVTKQFITGDSARHLLGRPNDLVGVVGFARVAHILSPLTLDHASVLEQLDKLTPVLQREADGTAIGYALLKTANLITATRHFSQELVEEGKPSYDIKSTAIILVTDGIHNPSPLDKEHTLRCMSILEAARQAAANAIRIYIINVEPAVRYPQFATQRAEQQKAAEVTGGRFYIADDPDALLRIYGEIDRLERVTLPQNRTYSAKIRERLVDFEPTSRHIVKELYIYLLGVGIAVLVLSRLLTVSWLRRVL